MRSVRRLPAVPYRAANQIQPRPIINNIMRCSGHDGHRDAMEPRRQDHGAWIDDGPRVQEMPRMVDRGSDARYPLVAPQGQPTLMDMVNQTEAQTPPAALVVATQPAGEQAVVVAPEGRLRRIFTLANVVHAITLIGRLIFATAQLISLFTPRINVGVAINPTWPADWPAFLTRRATNIT